MGAQARKEKRERRADYEFSGSVKNTVTQRSGGTCEECESYRASEFHHKVSIATAIMMGWEASFVASADNCLHVCSYCHAVLDVTA
ncbi:MAG: hypothetical protein UX62_C0016G0004 [Microgenomates group bacterium GW2011_GWA2_46_7]|nr:MAG: hypothetical protein UX62_C0016G0004 [Microgenomates group bacterium GW2011_GWA2_46_7]